MRRILFLCLFLVVAFAAGWAADNAGEFSLNWLGYYIEGSVSFLLIALVLGSALIWIILHWINTLLHLPSDLKRERERLQNEKGLELLTQAMIAASESDPKRAKLHLAKARKYLSNSPLPRLMQLQLAARDKDIDAVHQQFLQLQNYDSTKALALRGLAEQSINQGDMDEALKHTETLLKIAPNLPSTQLLAIDIFACHHRWQEAEKLIKRAYSQRHITADLHKRTAATLAAQQAVIMLEQKNRSGAMEAFKKAVSIDPSLQPAAIHYSELLHQIGKTSQAAKILRYSWKTSPHPAVAEQYQKLYQDLAPEKKVKKLQELAQQNKNSLESQILLAKAAMIGEKWDEAKNYLKIGLSKQNTVALCQMMAKLYNRGYNNETEERRWLEKAITATPDATWLCLNCKDMPLNWRAHCGICFDFASIYWQPERPLAAI